MNKTPSPTDPFTGFLESLVDNLATSLEKRLKPHLLQPAQLLSQENTIELMKPYTAKEVAAFLGVNRVESIYEIPPDELPRVKRIGSSIGYLGINVLCYMLSLPPVDMQALVLQYKAQLEEESCQIHSIKAKNGAMKRVI